MLKINGSQGEGGGQVLRSALALSMVTGQACCIEDIRAGRKKPGLMRQHLTAVQAAQRVCEATASGDAIGSRTLRFEPGRVRGGDYHFAVGTAGSATLVLQTVLPALLLAEGPSRLTLEGGTHNPLAPPFDFLAKVFLPLVNRMGPHVSATLERAGFYPAGGGCMTIEIEPSRQLQGFELLQRGEARSHRARALVAKLPRPIAERELRVIERKLGWSGDDLTVEEVDSPGPGNVVMLEVQSGHVTELFTGFGHKGVRAEAVADQAVQPCRRYLKSDVPVGEYLADQLLLPLAIAGRGVFRTLGLSCHTRTHVELIHQMLDTNVTMEEEGRDRWLVRLGKDV